MLISLPRRAARIVCKSNRSDVALKHLQWPALSDTRETGHACLQTCK